MISYTILMAGFMRLQDLNKPEPQSSGYATKRFVFVYTFRPQNEMAEK